MDLHIVYLLLNKLNVNLCQLYKLKFTTKKLKTPKHDFLNTIVFSSIFTNKSKSADCIQAKGLHQDLVHVKKLTNH